MVDADVWRGWSPSERALRLLVDNWERYEGRLYDNPVLTKSLINMVIYTEVAEWLSQVLRAAKGYVDHCVGEECDVSGGDGERAAPPLPLRFDLGSVLRNGLSARVRPGRALLL